MEGEGKGKMGGKGRAGEGKEEEGVASVV